MRQILQDYNRQGNRRNRVNNHDQNDIIHRITNNRQQRENIRKESKYFILISSLMKLVISVLFLNSYINVCIHISSNNCHTTYFISNIDIKSSLSHAISRSNRKLIICNIYSISDNFEELEINLMSEIQVMKKKNDEFD